jgi:HECT-domain (ubiquitin-transferase)/Regulator of chromosome condensation (RCC1) repeat
LAGVRVAAIAAGARHWLALDAAGRVWACGHNSSGQCGTGATGSLYEPAVLTALWPVAVVAVSAGDSHSAVLTATGDVFCFGSGQYGQIGQPSFSPKVCAVRPLRVAVPGVPGSGGGSGEDDDRDVDMVGNGEEDVEQIRGGIGGPSGREDLYYMDVACGGMHTVALRSDGAVVAWGMGEQGQVGHRSTANAYTPVVVRPSAPDADLRFVAVSAGARHSAALSDSGRAFLWGDGSLGQVGDGDVADKLLPVEARPPRVEGGLVAGAAPPRFTRLWCGGWHNIAFVSDSPAAAEPVYVPWAAYRQRVPLVQLDAMVQPKSGFARFSSSAVLTRNFVAPGHGNTVLAGECVKAYARFRTVFGDDGFSVLVRSAARLRHEAQAAFGMRRDGDRLLVTSPTRNAATAGIMTASGEVKAMTTPQDRLSTEDAFRADVADMRESGIVLFLAFLNPVYEQQSRERMRDLAELIALVVRVRGDARDAFVRGARSCPPEFLEKCFVRPLQRVISEELLGKRRVTKRTTNATKVLGLLHQANEEKLEAILAESGSAAAMRAMTDGGDDPSLSVVPAESFYNDAVSEMIDLKEDWARWNHVQKEIKEGRYGLDGAVVGEDGSSRSRGEGPFSFCEYSFVLNKLAKQKILGVEAHTAMHDELFRSLISFGTLSMPMDFSHAQNMGFLVLDVRRNHIVSDTFHQLAACVAQAPRDLHKTLRVQFQGEPGQDEGGLTKEFFQVLFEELLGGSYGMFVYHEDTRHHWFAQDSPCEPSDFMLVGIAVGLALFNTILLDVQFPSVIYHKLHGALQKALGKRKVAYKATLADVKDVFPDNYSTLRHVLEYDGDDLENDFGLTYEVGYQSVLGDNCTKELVADGANRPVTKENREEFVQLYIEYLINDSIAESFDQFSQGIFGMLAHGNFVSKVSASELETLVVGEVELDFEALRAATKYEGYSADSPVIKYLWEVLFSFDVESRKKFLSFVCGSDRAPIGGLGNLKLLIQRSSGDSNRLPTAHTCFNVLLLPEYATRAKVDALLRVAINNSTGFGLN